MSDRSSHRRFDGTLVTVPFGGENVERTARDEYRTLLDEYDYGILVPEAVVECGLVKPEGRVFWVVDTLDDAVFVSRYPDRFLSTDRFTFIGTSTVGRQRFTRPPKQLYPDYADEVDLHIPILDAKRTVQFEYTEWLLERDLCRVIPVE